MSKLIKITKKTKVYKAATMAIPDPFNLVNTSNAISLPFKLTTEINGSRVYITNISSIGEVAFNSIKEKLNYFIHTNFKLAPRPVELSCDNDVLILSFILIEKPQNDPDYMKTLAKNIQENYNTNNKTNIRIESCLLVEDVLINMEEPVNNNIDVIKTVLSNLNLNSVKIVGYNWNPDTAELLFTLGKNNKGYQKNFLGSNWANNSKKLLERIRNNINLELCDNVSYRTYKFSKRAVKLTTNVVYLGITIYGLVIAEHIATVLRCNRKWMITNGYIFRIAH